MSPWLREAIGGYWDNPVTLRDFRVQFRNGRVVAMFIVFTLLIALITYLSYESATRDAQGISSLQSNLTGMYSAVLGILYFLVAAISGTSAAFSIIAEKQRQSLDLVFSAPFSPRRYVIGKMVSGLRYSAILVAASLPALASTIVAGGATVEDMLIHGALIIGNAAMYTAIAIGLAGIGKSYIQPLAGTIGFGFLWTLVTGSVASISGFSLMPGSSLQPWFVSFSLLSPSIGIISPLQPVDFFGHTIAAWMPAVVILALVSRFAIVAAIASLEYPVGKAAVSLRIHGWLYALILGGLTSALLPRTTLGSFGNTFFPVAMASILGSMAVLTLYFSAPFGPDRPVKKPDMTSINFKRIFHPDSSSALPYALGWIAIFWLPTIALWPGTREYFVWPPIIYSFVLIGFWAVMLRGACFLLRTAFHGKVVTVVLMILSLILSVVVTSATTMHSGSEGSSVISMFRPWIASEPGHISGCWGTIFIYGLSTIVGFIALEVSQRGARTQPLP